MACSQELFTDAEELLSFITAVRGIKFYPGLADLIASKVLVVDLLQEKCNEHDTNAIIVMTRSDEPKILGHLERSSAAAVTKILQLHGVKIHKRSYLYKLVYALVSVLFCCNCTASILFFISAAFV